MFTMIAITYLAIGFFKGTRMMSFMVEETVESKARCWWSYLFFWPILVNTPPSNWHDDEWTLVAQRNIQAVWRISTLPLLLLVIGVVVAIIYFSTGGF